MPGDRNALEALPVFTGMLTDPYIRSARYANREDGGEKTGFHDLLRFCGNMSKLNFVISPHKFFLLL